VYKRPNNIFLEQTSDDVTSSSHSFQHLRSDHHRRFARNSTNFKTLDELINKEINFKSFLADLKAAARLEKLNQ